MINHVILGRSRGMPKKKHVVRLACWLMCGWMVWHTSGLYGILFAKSFQDFSWPPYGNVREQALENPPSFPLITLATDVSMSRMDELCPVCSRKASSLLRVYVKSAAQNVEARTAIRQTWGALFNANDVEVIFVTGVASDDDAALNAEILQHRDVLKGDFFDSYRNNTKKFVLSVAAASGLIEGCDATDFSLLVDDDYYLNVGGLLDFLATQDASKPLYMGWKFETSPFRSIWSKHSVSLEQYPFDAYPAYISAGAVLISKHSANKFAAAIPFVKLYLMDDVYAGIVAHLQGIPATHDARFQFWSQKFTFSEFQSLFAAHGFKPQSMYKMHSSI